MAGHSKWANIKHRKSANDAKRGKLFSKLVREITMASKQGGTIPESNPRLRLAIQHAKSANLPRENIEKAIKKGGSKDGDAYTEVTYEGYAAHGIAVIVECVTDNLNRTVAAVRSLFAKHGGSLGKSGALAFVFDKKGVFTVKKKIEIDEEELTLTMIEAGAEAIDTKENSFYITCPIDTFGHVQQSLEAIQVTIDDAVLQYTPNTTVGLHKNVASHVIKLINSLEDHDDVQRVFHNMTVSN